MSYMAVNNSGASGSSEVQRQELVDWYAKKFGYSQHDSMGGASSSYTSPITSKTRLTTAQHAIGSEGIPNAEKLSLFRTMLDVEGDETVDARTIKVTLSKAFQCLPKVIQDTIERKCVFAMTSGEHSSLGPEFILENMGTVQFKQAVEDTMPLFPLDADVKTPQGNLRGAYSHLIRSRGAVDVSPAQEDKPTSRLIGKKDSHVSYGSTEDQETSSHRSLQSKKEEYSFLGVCSPFTAISKLLERCMAHLFTKKEEKTG